MPKIAFYLISLLITLILIVETRAADWQAGFAKVDVTPKEPVRMSGYGNRDHPSQGVDTPLHVRAMSLREGSDAGRVLVSVDTIGLDAALCKKVAEYAQLQHNLSRDRLVLCSTHTHCAPDLDSNLDNIFTTPLTPEEKAAAGRYRQQLIEGIEQAIDRSLANMQPALIAHAQGKAGFAGNRRVLKDGKWSAFGLQADGPVDHTVPVLRITDPQGKVRGVVFNYACHCTTLGGDYYRINAEWAGYAAQNIESSLDGAVALCTIGCGADANPNPRSTLELAQLHGREMSQAVLNVVRGQMRPIQASMISHFDYAGLSFELPTIEELRTRAMDSNPQTRRHAEKMVAIYQKEGRLPATYPVPIQDWKFGDELQMIFLGGEVVVDYALRLKRETNNPNLWVTAYSNDVMGYVASERMRTEGGYEYDRSGIYYGLPGPWAAGTEDLLIRRVLELGKQRNVDRPISAADSLQQLHVADGYEVQLVAAEPLIQDPINIAFGPDGKLWVVEMGDYPLGPAGTNSGGRVKYLEDTDRDGQFDRATLFIDKLSFPTGVVPWRDGVLISAAPNILFARDRDGDGHADEQTVLYSGFPLANPQHRINGFTYGLDHSLHLASGDNLGEILSAKTGDRVNASGRDVQIWPDAGKVAATSGRTQYVRSRDDWGNWFGNDNSRPMYHYPIEDNYLRRNTAVRLSGNNKSLFTPALAPVVFPSSRTVERFNDLNAANRFTSACSAILFRSPKLGPEAAESLFVCEPVHNLVHRSLVRHDGASFRAERVKSEQQSEFLSSSDPWFRPVRVATGTDGMLWVVDMYRLVIEHPEWIPMAWQQQLDLRAGETMGRIYRIVPRDSGKIALPRITELATTELCEMLESDIGPLRDLVQQRLLQNPDEKAWRTLSQRVDKIANPAARLQALWTLAVADKLEKEQLIAALGDAHPGLVAGAVRLSENYFRDDGNVWQSIEKLANHSDAKVRLQVALRCGGAGDARAEKVLVQMVSGDISDAWVRRALISSATKNNLAMLHAACERMGERPVQEIAPTMELVRQLIETAGPAEPKVRTEIATQLKRIEQNPIWSLPFAAELAGIDRLLGDSGSELRMALNRFYQAAIQQIESPSPSQPDGNAARKMALQMVGRGLGDSDRETKLLIELLNPTVSTEIQNIAIDRLASMRDSASVDKVLSKWDSLSQSTRERFEQHGLSVPQWSQQILNRLEQGTLNPRELSLAFRQQMKNVGSRSFRSRVDRVLGEADPRSRKQVIEDYLAAQVKPGDASRGQALFAKHCATCHSGKPESAAIGPQLSNLSNRSLRALMEAILDPNLAVDPQYRSYTVVLHSGLTANGVIAEEVGESLTIAHHDGKRTLVRRDDIESMRDSGKSLMPEGLEQVLDPQAIHDLVAFLRQ